MKYLTLIRHAKSSWKEPGLADYDRPLNKRGQHDAPRVGSELQRRQINFDKVYCSSALRARQTLEGLSRELPIDERLVEFSREIYLASPITLKRIVALQPPSLSDIALIGHNPGIEEFADQLSLYGFDHMPTCCVVRLAFDDVDGSWPAAISGDGNIELVIRPRELEQIR
jgi:phosphohistidine phosphatase